MDNTYSKRTATIDGKDVEVFGKTLGELGNVSVKAGTNGFCDGEYMNSRTYIRFEKTGSSFRPPSVAAASIGNGFQGFSMECFGDEGLRDCIEALEFMLNVLKNQSGYDTE